MRKNIKNYWVILMGLVMIACPLLGNEIPLVDEIPLVIEGRGVSVKYEYETVQVGINKVIRPLEIIEEEAGTLKVGTLIEIKLDTVENIRNVKVPNIEIIGDLVLRNPKIISTSEEKSICLEVKCSSTKKSKIIVKNGSISLNRTTPEGQSYPLSITIDIGDEKQIMEITKLFETKPSNRYSEITTRWGIGSDRVTSSTKVPLPQLKAPLHMIEDSLMIPLRYYIEEVCKDGLVMAYHKDVLTYKVKDNVMNVKINSNQLTIGEKSIELKGKVQLKDGHIYIDAEDINLICNNTLLQDQVKIRWLIPNKIVEIVAFDYYLE